MREYASLTPRFGLNPNSEVSTSCLAQSRGGAKNSTASTAGIFLGWTAHCFLFWLCVLATLREVCFGDRVEAGPVLSSMAAMKFIVRALLRLCSLVVFAQAQLLHPSRGFAADPHSASVLNK